MISRVGGTGTDRRRLGPTSGFRSERIANFVWSADSSPMMASRPRAQIAQSVGEHFVAAANEVSISAV